MYPFSLPFPFPSPSSPPTTKKTKRFRALYVLPAESRQWQRSFLKPSCRAHCVFCCPCFRVQSKNRDVYAFFSEAELPTSHVAVLGLPHDQKRPRKRLCLLLSFLARAIKKIVDIYAFFSEIKSSGQLRLVLSLFPRTIKKVAEILFFSEIKLSSLLCLFLSLLHRKIKKIVDNLAFLFLKRSRRAHSVF